MNDILPYEKKAQSLVSILKNIFGDEREKTILLILSCVCDYEEDVDELLSFINNGNVDQADIVMKAYDIAQEREPDD